MTRQEVYKIMRAPSDTEAAYIRCKLYRIYTKRSSIFTILEMLCLLSAVTMVLIMLDTHDVTFPSILAILCLLLAGGSCFMAHVKLSFGSGMDKDLKSGAFKVIACRLVDLKYEKSSNYRRPPTPYARVRFDDNSIPAEYFRVDSTTAARLNQNSELPLMLVSNGTVWRVIQMSEW